MVVFFAPIAAKASPAAHAGVVAQFAEVGFLPGSCRAERAKRRKREKRDSISFLDFVNIFQVLDPRYDSGVREMVAWKLVDVDGDGLLGYDDLCYFLTTLLHGQGVGSAEIRYKADVVMDDYGLGEDGFIGRGTFFSLFKDSLMRVISIPPAP